MKRIVFLLTIAALVSACSLNGKPQRKNFASTVCSRPVDGFTVTKIQYGAAHLSMKYDSEAIQNSEIRFELQPKKGFENATVTITGKNSASNFLSSSGSKGLAPKGVIVASDCVDQSAPIGTIYEFDVEVAGVGKLDPRIEVVRR